MPPKSVPIHSLKEKGRGKRIRQDEPQKPPYDTFRFVSSRANNYFEGFVNRKLTPERGFDFSKKENEGILRIVERRGWQQWVAHSQVEVSKILIMEFYSNLMGAYYLNRRAKACFV